MNHYFARVTTQYDGLEYCELVITEARNKKSAVNKINKTDLTHDNGIEEQYPIIEDSLIEVPEHEAKIVRKYVLEV